MKQITVFLLSAGILLLVTGCGSPVPAEQQQNFTFTYNELTIPLGADALPVLQALGDPVSYTETPSCAFDGVDKTYYFGSFYLSTCPQNERDAVYRIWLADDSVAAEGGVRIGQTQAQAEAVFGADCFGSNDAYTQIQGNSTLTVLLTDGIVSSIQYEWIPD